jgi:hypothetical protein
MGSKRAFSCAMLQDGEIRRSEDELGEVMRSGTSAALWRDISAEKRIRGLIREVNFSQTRCW